MPLLSEKRKEILIEAWPFMLSKIFGTGTNYITVYLMTHYGSEQERSNNLAASSLIVRVQPPPYIVICRPECHKRISIKNISNYSKKT